MLWHKIDNKYLSGISSIRILINGAAALFFFNILLGFISSSTGILIIYLLKTISEKIKNISIENIDFLHPELYILISILLFQFFIISLSRITGNKYLNKITRSVFNSIHNQAIHLDIKYFETNDKYEKLHRALSESSYRPAIASIHIRQFLSGILSLLFISLILIRTDTGLLYILLVAYLPLLAVYIINSSKTHKLYKLQTRSERKLDYYNYVLTDYHLSKELRILGIGNFFREKFMNLRDSVNRKKIRLLYNSEYNILLTRLFGILIIASFYINKYINPEYIILNSGDLIFITGIIIKGILIIDNLCKGLSGLYEDKVFLSNINEFLSIKSIKLNLPIIHFPDKIITGIKIINLDFTYPGCYNKVFNKLNLEFKQGELTVICGQNGTGKSTLLKLLAGLYKPDSGRILIEDTNLDYIPVEKLRENFSILSQDYKLFYLSISENIHLGNPEKSGNIRNISSAANFSGIQSLITELPNGYNSIIGKSLEHGVELSSGEFQKLALSRTIFKNSRIIILDEPFSAIDPDSEKKIFTNLKALSENRIVIIISHKFSLIEKADRVIYLPA